MKKKYLYAALSISMILLCSCGKTENVTVDQDIGVAGQETENISEISEESEVSENSTEDVVTGSGKIIYEDAEISLCDYKNLTVMVDTYEDYEPTQEELDAYYDYIISSAEEAMNATYDGSDAWISEHFSDYETVQELQADLKEEYISEKQGSVAATSANALIEYLYQNSSFSPSDERLSIMRYRLKHYYTDLASDYGWESLEQMLVWEFGYETWEDFTQSDYFKERLETNTNMDLMFDTLAVQTGIAEHYGIDPAGITETILKDPEHADYETVLSEKQALQRMVTDYIYKNCTMKDQSGEEVEKLEYYEY